MSRSRSVALHFLGAAVTKLAPPVVQLTLLLVVARAGTLADVGRLALASAVSFFCGALAELGFSTTLSLPQVALGTPAPPLAGTRRVRVSAGAAGVALYVALWGAGLGGHEPVLLLAAPLPYALALSYGYAGAMNAAGLLRYEGTIAAAESALILVVALGAAAVGRALPGALLGLVLGRAAGTAARAYTVRRLPRSDAPRIPALMRAQLPYAIATIAVVLQGQLDMVAIGLLGTLTLAGVYGPLVRTAYSGLLGAEALSWGLYGSAHPDERGASGFVSRHWRSLAVAGGVLVAIAFALLAEPFLRFLIGHPLPDLTLAVALFGVVVAARFLTLVLNVEILRSGRQREQIPVLVAASVVLAVGAALAARAGSVSWLAGTRLASEAVIAAGYLLIARRGGTRSVPEPPFDVTRGAHPLRDDGMRRILFLTPFPPRLDAAHGGRTSAQLIAALAETNRVAVLCVRQPDEPETDPEIRRRCDLVVEVPRARSISGVWGARIARCSRLVRGVPGLVDRAAAPAYAARLTELVREWRPDVVQVELHEMAQFLPALDGFPARRVLVEHDPGADASHDLGVAGGPLARFSHMHEEYAWRRYGRRTLPAVDAVVVFTDRDRRAVEAQRRGTRVVRIPLVAHVPDVPSNPAGAGPPTLLLHGGYEHPPNADAARRLLEAIFPCVRARIPAAELKIVGPKPTQEMLQRGGAGIEITGYVPEVAPYLDEAAVVVVPLRLGGGMRVKVLETLAAGKALVASARAVDGLDVVPGRDFLLAETDEEFCRASCELLEDPERRVALARSARAWAEANLDVDAVARAYEGLYESLLPRSAVAAVDA